MIGATKESFRDYIQKISGTLTQWSADPAPFTPPGATVPAGVVFNPSILIPTAAGLQGKSMITLRILSALMVGHDETRYSFNISTDKNLATQSGIRTYVISIVCRTHADAPDAAEILELLRTRMGRPSAVRALRALNISIAHIYQVVEMLEPNTQITGRPIGGTVAVMDIKFNWGMNDLDTTDPGDYISDAPTTGTITGTIDDTDTINTVTTT